MVISRRPSLQTSEDKRSVPPASSRRAHGQSGERVWSQTVELGRTMAFWMLKLRETRKESWRVDQIPDGMRAGQMSSDLVSPRRTDRNNYDL